jgi:hypothetical protein
MVSQWWVVWGYSVAVAQPLKPHQQNGAKKKKQRPTAASAMTPLLLPSPPLPPGVLHCSSKPTVRHARRLGRAPNAASDGGSSGESSPAATDPSTTTDTPKPAGVKNRLRARNQSRRAQLDAPPEVVATPKKKKAAPRRESPRAPKKWEEMSLAEKALELYVGEKGMLFWLNKFAYASIFIMAGAWILFRFVGPSLGLYQLDAPPLAPTAVLGG